MTRFRFRVTVAVCALAIVCFLGAGFAYTQSRQAALSNFGQVTPHLYRGAQPSDAGFQSLKQMGVTMVVNFRDDWEAKPEEGEVESLGMQYVNIPWRAADEPSNAQVAQFLDLVRDNPTATIFVHCRRGADRTGTMIAAYRIVEEHESIRDAVSEMHRYHYAHFFLPHLERYVDSLPQLLRTDSRFSAYEPKPASLRATAVAAVSVPVAR